ncbi:MAG: DUF4130 domain-containing protein [Candidatus Kariarchaeaceae archaeon]
MSFFRQTPARQLVRTASYHADSTDEFNEEARALLDTAPYEIITKCSEMGTLINKRASAVYREASQITSFVSFEPLPEMILMGECVMEHNSFPIISRWLCNRLKNFIILIFTQKTFFVASNRKDIGSFPEFKGETRDEIIEKVRTFAREAFEERLPSGYLIEEGELYWKEYYETQFLEQRTNLKLFHSYLSKKVLEKDNLRLEREFLEKITLQNESYHTLDDFMD